MKLWLGNIAPDTSDDEVRAFLEKYGVPAVIAVERVAAEGSRPAAMVEVAAAPDTLNRLTQRLNGMYWKGRSLTVQAMTR
jgi:RNA recognition motif-containing protein